MFAETSWRNKTLFSVSQAGLVNNLNDGMSWGVFPLLFIANGVTLEGVGLIKAVYPIIWGVGQIVTGSMADRVGRKRLIVWGMLVQAAGHVVIGAGAGDSDGRGPGRFDVARRRNRDGLSRIARGGQRRGPSILASDVAWRLPLLARLGYAVGALMSGLIAGALGLVAAVHAAGLLTLISGLVAWRSMSETLPRRSVK